MQLTPGELYYITWDMVMNTCERSFRLYGDQALKSKCVYAKGGLPMTSSSYEIQSMECGSSSRISPFDLFN